MSNTIQIKRGANASLQILDAAEPAFSTDTKQVYIGDGTTNYELVKVGDAVGVLLTIKEENTSAISKGQVCVATGSSGEKIEVGLGDCADATKIRIIGLASTDIVQNAAGYAIYKGALEDVDTRPTNLTVNPNAETWVAGDMLWVADTPGGMTKVRPTSGRMIKAAITVKGSVETDTLVAISHENPISSTAASGEDIIERMGDSAGTNKVSYRDYGNNEVASIDSKGRATFTGQVHWSKGADVASANALTLGTDGNLFDITGTTAITSIGTLGVGTVVVLHFDGALTLTHNAADLILPGGANITTSAGDEAMFVEYATGDWRCVSYTKADGTAVVAQEYTPGGTDVAIADGGTGAGTAQDAIDALSQVSGEPDEYILTKDTGTGNAKWKAPTGAPGGKASIWLGAEGAYLPATNPAALTEVAGATTYGGWSYLAFDDATSEHAVWRVPMSNYDGGNITVTAFSKPATTPGGAVTLQYNILTIGLATSEAFNSADTVDTTVNIVHSMNTTELQTDIMVASNTIDPANVAAGDLMVFELSRDVTSDDLVGDGQLVGILLEYTRT